MQTNKQHIIETNKTGPEIKSMQETHMKHVRTHEQTNNFLNTQEKPMKQFRKVKIARKARETIEKTRSSEQIKKTSRNIT